jgi:hypothetical protein
MASGITKTPFKDGIVKASSGSPDLEFEGGPKFAQPEFNLEGAKVVVSLGEGDVTFGGKDIE